MLEIVDAFIIKRFNQLGKFIHPLISLSIVYCTVMYFILTGTNNIVLSAISFSMFAVTGGIIYYITGQYSIKLWKITTYFWRIFFLLLTICSIVYIILTDSCNIVSFVKYLGVTICFYLLATDNHKLNK